MKKYACSVGSQEEADELSRLCQEHCPDIQEGDISTHLEGYKFFCLAVIGEIEDGLSTFVGSSLSMIDDEGERELTLIQYHEMVEKITS